MKKKFSPQDNSRLKFMVVGLGSMGRRRLRNLTYLGFKNIIAAELNEARRKEVEKEFGIQTFSSFDEAILENPDAIIISTPPNLHTVFAKKAAELGKPFFIEASVLNDGLDEVNRIAKSKKAIAVPSCTMRFKQSIQKIKELIEAGKIGKPLAFTYHMGQYLPDWHPWEDVSKFYVGKRETGAGREMFCFELEWLTWIFGSLQAVSCMKGKLSEIKADIDDAYAILYKFSSGAVGTVMIDVISRDPVRSLHIMGSEGSITWDWNTSTVRLYDPESKSWSEFKETEKVAQPGYWAKDDMYIEEMKYFVNCATGAEKVSYSLDDDLRILKFLVDAEMSSDKGVHIRV